MKNQTVLFVKWLLMPQNILHLISFVNDIKEIIEETFVNQPHPLWYFSAFRNYAKKIAENKLEELEGSEFVKTSGGMHWNSHKSLYLFLYEYQLLDMDIDKLKSIKVSVDHVGGASFFIPVVEEAQTEEGIEVEFENAETEDDKEERDIWS